MDDFPRLYGRAEKLFWLSLFHVRYNFHLDISVDAGRQIPQGGGGALRRRPELRKGYRALSGSDIRAASIRNSATRCSDRMAIDVSQERALQQASERESRREETGAHSFTGRR
jgi:hypothetical protein